MGGPAIEVVQILSVVACLQTTVATVGPIYLATGSNRTPPGVGKLVSTAAVVIAFVVGLQWGIAGVARGYAVAQSLLIYPSLSIPLRLIGLRVCLTPCRPWLVRWPSRPLQVGLVVVVGWSMAGRGANWLSSPLSSRLAVASPTWVEVGS